MRFNEKLKITAITCLQCGAKLDGTAGVNEAHTPTPGSISICIYCANVAVFGEDMQLRAMTAEEKQEIEQVPHIQEIVSTIKEVQQEMKPPLLH